MSGDEVATLTDLLTQGGLAGALAVAIVGALKEWWVPGATYRRALADAEKWRALALRGTGVAEKAVELAEQDVG